MMHRIKQWLFSHWPELTILLAVAVLGLQNIHWNQYLLGWDSTTPELNFSLNFQRFIFGTWQEYRGLGTQDGMAHTSLIVQWAYAWLLDLVLPTTTVRPVLNLFTLLAGGWGMLRLTQDFFLPELKKTLSIPQISDHRTQLLSTFAALMYMLNPLTLQLYHLPLELFSFHFAIIAWGMWALLRFFKQPTKQSALVLLFINFAGASQAHVPTVVVSYAIQLAVITVPFLLAKKISIRVAAAAAGIIFAANAFWGVPYMYSTIQKSAEIANSKQNLIGTPSAFFRNNAWGTLQALSTFGGFTYSYTDWNEDTNQFEPIMQEWISYWQHPLYQSLTATFSAAVFFTTLYLGWKALRRKNTMIGVAVLLFVSLLTLLGTSIPILGNISAFFREYVPLYEQIFRFTFTKFSMLYVLSFSLMATLSLAFWSNYIRSQKVQNGILFVFCIFPIALALPAWKGELFYSKLWVDLPASYPQVAEYFENRPTARVLSLPIHSLWGWTTNTTSWGYRGSGFFWQMNPVPLVDRSFDPWEDSNETAYLQLNQAVYASDTETFISLLKTYHISHLLLDTSVFHPGNYQENIYIPELKRMLEDTRFILDAEYDSLSIYRLLDDRDTSLYTVTSPQIIADQPVLYPQVPVANTDNYIVETSGSSQGLFFPFKYVTSNRPLLENVILSENILTLTTDRSSTSNFEIPDYTQFQKEIPVALTIGNSKVQAETLLPWSATRPDEYVFSFAHSSSGYLTLENRLVAIMTPEAPNLLLYFPSQQTSVLSQYSDTARNVARQSDVLTSKGDCNQRHNLSNSREINPDIYCSSGDLQFEVPSSDNNVSEPATTELIGVFVTKPDDKAYSICIHSVETDSECINSITQEITTDSGERLLTTNFVRTITQNYQIEIGSTGQSIPKTLVIQSYPRINQFSFDPKPILDRAKNEVLDGIKNNAVNITVPAGLNQIDLNKRAVTNQINCSKKLQSTTEKKLSLINEVLYSATNGGFLCDSVLLPEISTDTQYIFTTKSSESSGAGYKYFLINPTTKRFDLEWIFPKNGGIEILSVWPSSNPEKTQRSDFMLSITGESFGHETNAITVSEISIIPAPLNWLSHIQSLEFSPGRPTMATIDTVQKISPTTYLTSMNLETDSHLVLPQSYDPAWLALSLSSFSFLPHLEYNGWANAWIVPEGSTKVLIIFWPQLLSFAGYGVLLLTIVLLSKKLQSPNLIRFWRSRFVRVRRTLGGTQR